MAFPRTLFGKISDIKALTAMGYGTEKEVLRVIAKSGDWRPAMLNGRPIKAYRRQPVSFILEEDGIDFNTARNFTFFEEVDNLLIIKVRKVNSDDITATISKGTITKTAGGTFIVRVPKTDAVIVELFNAKNRSLGSAHFLVRPQAEPPKPKN